MQAEKYSLSLRVLHWLMAVIVLTLIGVGYVMSGLEREDPLRPLLYEMHKSTGLVILALAAVRLLMRAKQSIPALPLFISRRERILAHGTHRLLYILLLLVPLSGWWMVNGYGFPTPFYGAALPPLFPVDRELAQTMNVAHEWGAYILLGLVSLHVAGALKHLLTGEYNGFRRMW